MTSPHDWQLIDDGSFNGVRKWIRAFDDDEGTVQVKTEADITAQLDRNKALQNEDFDRRSDMWHVAHIPIGIQFEWIAKHGVNMWNPAHADGVKRLLNDSEYRWLRTKDVII
jgi:hypothetical protein